MTRFEKIILSITGGSHLSVHALMLALPSLIPIIRNEFNVGLDILGFVVTVSAFMFGLGAIPAGWAEKRFGGRSLLLIYQVGSSLSALLVALSSSFIMMIVGLGFMGFFCSIYHPAGLTLISHRVKSLTRGMAIHGIFGSTGSALGPLLATTLAALISWENTTSILPNLTENMKAGLFPTMVFIAGIGGQIIGARIGERFHKPTALIYIIMANIPFLILMGYTSDIFLIISGIFLGIAYFSNQPIGNTLIANFTNSQNRGIGYGLSFFISFGIGSFAAGFSGLIAENMGVAAVFPAMGLLLIPSVLFAFLMSRAARSS